MSEQPTALRLAELGYPDICDEAADELRRLHAENETLKEAYRLWMSVPQIQKLKAERDAYKADAERYQLLKSRVEEYDGHACFTDIPLPCPIPDVSPFDRIDAAIDAAKEKT